MLHFLRPSSPADGCAQLTERFKEQLDRRYGPCLTSIGLNPPATGIAFIRVKIAGAKATAEVRYGFRGRSYHELFSLLRQRLRWRIDDARLLT